MPLPNFLHVKHTITYQDEPLVHFSDLPGYDAELTPAQIRALALALLRAADDCEAQFARTRKNGPMHRKYPVGAAVSAPPAPVQLDAMASAQ